MGDDNLVIDAAGRLLGEARDELARADAKASSALTALVAVVAVALARNAPPATRLMLSWSWSGGLLLCAIAMILLLLAVLPRFTSRARGDLVCYFGDVAAVRSDGELAHRLGQATDRSHELVLRELRAVSAIVMAKYRYTRWGILCAAVGASLLLASAL